MNQLGKIGLISNLTRGRGEGATRGNIQPASFRRVAASPHHVQFIFDEFADHIAKEFIRKMLTTSLRRRCSVG